MTVIQTNYLDVLQYNCFQVLQYFWIIIVKGCKKNIINKKKISVYRKNIE